MKALWVGREEAEVAARQLNERSSPGWGPMPAHPAAENQGGREGGGRGGTPTQPTASPWGGADTMPRAGLQSLRGCETADGWMERSTPGASRAPSHVGKGQQMSSVGPRGGHNEGRVGRALGNVACIAPAGGAQPHLGRACLPLSTQNTYNLNSSLAGKQESSTVRNLCWVWPQAQM